MKCFCGCGKDTPIAIQNNTRRGWIKGRPTKWCHGHRGSSTLSALFEKHVIRTDGCWGWNGATNEFGYGFLRHKKQTLRAHRVSWQLENGEIPDGLGVLHRCDNPACSRPDHLFLGSNDDNIADKVRKNRHAKGVAFPIAKLNQQSATTIRSMYATGIFQRVIAKKFGVCQQTVSSIIAGKTWKNGNTETPTA